MCRTAINVTGDLTTCVVMNKIIPSEKSAQQEIKEEEQRETHRMITGTDVIVKRLPIAH